MKHGSLGVFLLAASLGQAPLARSGEAPAELAQPVSPGSIALLAEATDRADAERRLSEALGDPRPEVRAAAARVTHARGTRALDQRLLAALETEAEPVAAVEMIRALATAASPVVDEKLIEAERRLGPPFGGVVVELYRSRAMLAQPDNDRSPATLPQGIRVRTLDDFPPRFLSDLMAVSGCSPDDDAAEAAEISYGPDGRPRKIALASLPLPDRCRPAVRAMFVCSILPRGEVLPADRKQVVLAALDRQVIASFDPSASPSAKLLGGAEHVGGSVKEPRRLKNVPPVYPEAARAARIEGKVIVEAVVASSGSVRTVRALTSVHPSLDFAAVRAVSQWRYAPTIVNGAAVPVIMTVTVNFRLN